MASSWNPPPPPTDARPPQRSWGVLRWVATLGIAGLALLGLAFVALMVWGFHQGARLQAVAAEARVFGATADEASCLAEAIARVESCRGLLCEWDQPYFLTECLRSSQAVPGFCDDVPAEEDDVEPWASARCEGWDAVGACAGLFYSVQEHCHYRPPRAEPPQ